MIKTGNLFKTKRADRLTGDNELCQVLSTYNKPDIDPECPESVAIVGMVEAVWMSGPHIGKTFRSARRNFNQNWEVVNDS